MSVSELLAMVRGVLRDADADAWSDEQILAALYEAELVTVNHRPDATATLADFSLASGPEQTIEALEPKPLRLLDIVGNVSDGRLVYAARRVHRTDLDTRFPGWLAAPEVSRVVEWIFDDRKPMGFMVNPPASSGTQVRVLYSALPTPYPDPLTPETQTSVGPAYAPALPEWALYRLFGHDVENSVNIARANQHLGVYGNLIGVQLESSLRYSPKRREHNAQ